MYTATSVPSKSPEPLMLTYNMRDLAVDAYLGAFYDVDNGLGHFKDTEHGDRLDSTHFWRYAEMIEVIEDAYERSGEKKYLQTVCELCEGFANAYTANWARNKFNDDLMWACIAFLRASTQTGDDRLAEVARKNFDATWARAYDDALDGGLWWTTDNTCKNACINGPASIAASLLYLKGFGADYRSKAMSAYDWITRQLFETTTGRVIDHIEIDGSLNRKVWTYNLGTFIGASTLLFEMTGSPQYLENGRLAMGYASTELTRQYGVGILDDEYGPRDAGGDSPGFKGIFARWAAYYTRKSGDTSFTPWLRLNAGTAWGHRNSSGVIWSRWGQRTPERVPNSFECSSAVALLQTCP